MFLNEKSSQQPSGVTYCPCKNEQGIFITHRHAAWIVSLLIVWSFFAFVAGYFLGQRALLEQFSTRLEQDSLSDKIYSSLCTLYEVDNEGEVTDNDSASNTEGEDGTSSEKEVGEQAQEESQRNDIKDALEKKVPKYYAALAGFGSAERAYAFAQRCTQNTIKVTVKKKPSTSTKGRTHYWYQVITQPYEDKKALIAAIDTIKRTEHIRDIAIQEL